MGSFELTNFMITEEKINYIQWFDYSLTNFIDSESLFYPCSDVECIDCVLGDIQSGCPVVLKPAEYHEVKRLFPEDFI